VELSVEEVVLNGIECDTRTGGSGRLSTNVTTRNIRRTYSKIRRHFPESG